MNTVLFDLDGTLTDPAEGITNSVAHALRRLGIEPPPRNELTSFIGPPLADSFSSQFGFSKEKSALAIELYREYYRDKGIFENKLYPGTKEMLDSIKTTGKKIMLATSKPEVFAIEILKYFGLYDYFDCCSGASLDEKLVRKADVIALTLARSSASPSDCVMVGDRLHAVEGAAAHGIPTVGVLFGYGSEQELRDAGAFATVSSMSELSEFLLNL